MAVEPDGSVTVYVGSSAIGQGLETVFAQIAADALEMSFDRVRVLHGSTTLLREGYGSYHSRARRDGRLGHAGGGRTLARGNPESGRETLRLRAGAKSPSTTKRFLGPAENR